MNAQIRFYGRLLLRRAPVMLLLFLAATLVGLILAAGLPATYASQGRLLVQGQAISEELATSTVQIDALEEVQLLREQLVTRSNLIDIANDFEVFEDIRGMAPDEIFAQMMAATSIQAEGGSASRRSGPSPVLLTVSFEARSGQIAADVVNEYVTRILTSNVRLRTGQAGETLNFFEQEVDRLNRELESRSARITEFQRENAGALPDDQDFRLQRQSLLQERIAAAERERRALVETRRRTVQIFDAGVAPAGTALPPDQQELRDLENQLEALLLTFSESAPQVQALRRRIELLQDRIAQQAEIRGEDDDETLDPVERVDPLLALQLTEIDGRIEALDAVLEESTAELAVLNDAIARTPLNAIQLQRLQRDYENVQLQFENARRALAQASIGERLEIGGRGQRITLLEPPVVPSQPIRPNRQLLAVGGAGAGLVLAMAFFLLLEVTNRTVRRPAELVRGIGITPFATLPYIETRRSAVLRRILQTAAILLILVGVPAGLWVVHSYVMPLDQLSRDVLERIGLA
jgi:polysaccharide chain length determinant protein (PEP-CTERM system associated)